MVVAGTAMARAVALAVPETRAKVVARAVGLGLLQSAKTVAMAVAAAVAAMAAAETRAMVVAAAVAAVAAAGKRLGLVPRSLTRPTLAGLTAIFAIGAPNATPLVIQLVRVTSDCTGCRPSFLAILPTFLLPLCPVPLLPP